MGRKIVWSSDDDEDFPSLDDLLVHPTAGSKRQGAKQTAAPLAPSKSRPLLKVAGTTPASKAPSSVRLRKFVKIGPQDNPLLRRLETKDVAGSIKPAGKPAGSPETRKQGTRRIAGALPFARNGRPASKCLVGSSDDESEQLGEDDRDTAFANASPSAHSSELDSPPCRRAATPDTVVGRRVLRPDNSPTPNTTEPNKGCLGSPKKLPGIPETPHGPSLDVFWSREFVDDWNDEHSPVKKLSFPSHKKCPTKADSQQPGSRAQSGPKSTPGRQTKKTFESKKHELARSFLEELDTVITGGRLGELAKATGGIQLNWTNKLNTTAGRANWKRETIRTSTSSGVDVQHKHHASIDLAEKVIDDETRLLNVIAHEFCHLANFMISGVTGNPHGKEFKGWAAKCTMGFADRGIQVTTKHTYEIDFKYIWQCTECGLEFKRHSKSINPERHRCGSCKSVLQQIKPKPRVHAKESEYQKFVRDQMKLVKADNPGSPQKDVMRIIADRWANKSSRMANASEAEDITDQLDKLTLEA